MSNVVSQSSISSSAAQTIVAAAIAHAEKERKAVCVAIVDPSGQLKSFVRMDGAPLLAINIAVSKAWTATSYGLATHDFAAFVAKDEALKNILHSPGLMVLGGGYPIVVDGTLVGAIGVSGGHYTEDMAIACAGLAAFEAKSK